MAGPGKVNPITGIFYRGSMFFFLCAIGFGVAFIATCTSSNFFKWKVNTCRVVGTPEDSNLLLQYDLNMTANIGWRDFTVTLDSGGAQCFETLESGASYPIADFQDNSAAAAGFGMVASWAVALVLALVTVVSMWAARDGVRKGGVSMITLATWCWVMSVGIVVATTVFWWMVEGKFGNRDEALAYRLLDVVYDAARVCDDDGILENCRRVNFSMDTPGWSLSLGITSMFMYGFATFLLHMRAPRTDALLNGADEPEPEPVKHVVGVADRVQQPVMGQADEKARATKDRRSARTGGRAPSSTVHADDMPTVEADPMTYALQDGGDEEAGEGLDEEVVYQNHQVHPSIVNHSTPNQSVPHPDDTMSRQSEAMSRASPAHITSAGTRQRQYSRGYSRGTSGASYTTGGHSFETPSDADFSDTASSAQYYAQHHGGSRSFMSTGSRGDSFDDYGQQR